MKNIVQKVKHNKKNILLIMMFFLVLLLPIGSFFMGSNVENIENKALQEKPQFNISTWQDYPQLYEAYYNDTIPYKKVFVNAYNSFIWNVFDESPGNYVIKGKDGWLFYNSKYKNDSDELGDYQRTSALSVAEMSIIVERMKSLQNLCNEIGAEFYVLIGPNKMEIYGDRYLPNAYVKTTAELNRTEQIVNLLNKENISVIYSKEKLLQESADAQVYYKLDTHWNMYGGYIAYREFMKMYDMNFDVNADSIQPYPKKSGDLANMIQMNDLDDIDFAISYKPEIDVQIIQNELATTSSAAKLRTQSNITNDKKLLMYRDSFTNALQPYMSKSFSEAYYLWTYSASEDEIRVENPDVVIFEIVERSIGAFSHVPWDVNLH